MQIGNATSQRLATSAITFGIGWLIFTGAAMASGSPPFATFDFGALIQAVLVGLFGVAWKSITDGQKRIEESMIPRHEVEKEIASIRRELQTCAVVHNSKEV